MEIIKIENYKENRFKTAIALGNFDGMHLGHRKLISTMVEDSKKSKITSSVLLFSKHPQEVLTGNSPELITSLVDKQDIMKQMGVEIIYETDFSEDFRKLSPEEFIKEFLVDKLNVSSIFVGFDYRFGYKASGNVNVLKELTDKYSLELTIIDPVYDEKRVLSSTEIRTLIKDGNISLANEMLDKYYKVTGKVVHGNKIGKTLGFPTANVELSNNYPIPKKGVYRTNTILDGKKYISLTSIGINPTVGGEILKIETYILDFDKSIYGQLIEIEFIEYLRDELMFNSLEDLKYQMEKDLQSIKSKA